MDLNRLVADAILAAAADAVVATDRDGIIRVWNRGAERIFGHRADDALGRSLDLIIPERLRARHWEGFRHVMATGESHYGEGDLLSVPGLRRDGQRISLEFTIVPLKDAGTDAGHCRRHARRNQPVRGNEKFQAEAGRAVARSSGR
jgi:PAS domain S-box-containing protein